MLGTPGILLGVHPFKVVGSITPSVAVQMVALGTFAIGVDGARSVEHRTNEDIACYTPKVRHKRGVATGSTYTVAGYFAGNSMGGAETVVDVPQSLACKGKEMLVLIDIQSSIGGILRSYIGCTEQQSFTAGGIGDDAVVGSKEVGMILNDLDLGWSAWLFFFLLFVLHCSDDL